MECPFTLLELWGTGGGGKICSWLLDELSLGNEGLFCEDDDLSLDAELFWGSSSMPGMLVRLALELDCFDEEDAFWLELDTPVSFLLELELPVVVFAFCFSEEVPVETFWEELEK